MFTESDLTGHEVWAKVAALRSAVTAFTKSSDEATLHRLRLCVELADTVDRLRDLPAWRFPGEPGGTSDVLKELADVLDEAEQDVSLAQSDADQYLDDLVPDLAKRLSRAAEILTRTPVPAVMAGHMKGIKAATEQYQQVVEAGVKRLRDQISASETSLSEVSEKTEESRLQVVAKQDALKAEIETLTATVATQTQRLDAAIADQGSLFTRHLGEWQRQIQAAIKTAEDDAVTSREAMETSGRATLGALAEMERQTREMVAVTARNTISTGYAQYARRQGWSAAAWSIGTVLAAVGGYLYIVHALGSLDGVSIGEAIYKSTASLALLGAAAFMGGQAAGHQREARDAKRMQLDLNALEPYLANMDPDDVKTLRREAAERIFTRPLANSRRPFLTKNRPSTDDE